ncbi:MAG: MFS transporter [Firmicutes bacterium]|nr:MFS transporter [Bacillota bacterium]
MPEEKKFAIALLVYIVINILEGTYLFLPIPMMAVFCGLTGLLGVTSYNIRISATQRYVPNEKKGRFNGAFNTLTMIGMLFGEILAGVLSVKLPIRLINMMICGVALVTAVILIGGHREDVAKIYNTQD